MLLATFLSVATFAQQITITKSVVEDDGSSSSETIVKKGDAARNFNIDAYIKENKADNVDLNIRSEGGDEERTIAIKGSEGPSKMRFKNFGDDVSEEVERTVDWVNNRVRINSGRNQSYYYSSASEDDESPFLGVQEDSDEDDDEPGVMVSIVKKSAADNAGMHCGDVIMSLNGTKVNEFGDISKFMEKAQKGEKVLIKYTRNGKDSEANAVLTTRKEAYAAQNEGCTQWNEQGFLGVSPAGQTKNGSTGARVNIVDKSAAKKAGLKNGDVIQSLNDKKIEDYEDIEDFMEKVKPGEKIKVQYEREGKSNTIEVTVGKRGAWDWGALDGKDDIEINICSKEACLGIYNDCNAGPNGAGVTILDFTDHSAAKDAGLLTGDVVVSVNDVPISSHEELWNELAKFQPSQSIRVGYLRNKQFDDVAVKLHPCDNSFNRVTMSSADQEGVGSERSFFTWDMAETDETPLRERRIIPLRHPADGDIPMISSLSDNESNPLRSARTLQLEELSITPDPNARTLTAAFRAAKVPTIITLYDMEGRQIFQEEMNVFFGEYEQTFDVQALMPGSLLLHIEQNGKAWSQVITL